MSRRSPPVWAEFALERLLGTGLAAESVLGDLAEAYDRMSARQPVLLCDLWYVRQALTLVVYRLVRRRGKRTGPSAVMQGSIAVRHGFGHAIGEWLRDLRYVVRSVLRQPVFNAVIVVTLSLAIGANAAVFGIIDRLLVRGPGYVVDRDRVVRLYAHVSNPSLGEVTGASFGYVTYTDLRDHASGLEAVAAYSTSTEVVGEGADARSLRAGYATASFFPLLGVPSQLGRFFVAEEDQPPRGQNVVVLDDGFWRSAFGADSSVIGETMRIGDEEMVVIGVAPRGFTGVRLEPVDIWLPMAFRGARTRSDWATTRSSSWLRIVVRLAPGVTADRASDEATAIHSRLAKSQAPEELRSHARLEFLPLDRTDVGTEPPEALVARWLVGVAAIVLLIAIANVSSLQLARGTRRKREVAVRLALGIDRARLVRHFLVESLVLAGAGTLLGLLVAHGGAQLIRAVLLPHVAWNTPPVDQRVLLFSAVTALLVGLAVGTVPALAGVRTDLTRSLKTGAREGGSRVGGFHTTLLIFQSGLALVLLIGAGLFVRSLQRAREIDLGFDADRVLVATVHWPSISGAAPEERARVRASRDQFVHEARNHFARLPWVESTSLTIGLPFQMSLGVLVRPRDRDSLPMFEGGGPNINAVSDDYFKTVGMTLVRGRFLTSSDVSGSEPVAVVNEAIARAFWPGSSALDQCLTMYDDPIPCVRVVGVVQDAKQWLLREVPTLQYYVPIAQAREISGPELLVRPIGDAESSIARVRAELLSLRPNLPYISVSTIQRWVDPQVRPWRMGAILFSLFGLLALTIAGSGLYSILAYMVEQRRQELGIRSALGATTARIMVETLKRGVLPTVVGLALGLLLAIPLASWLEPQLFETSSRDMLVYVAAAALLLVVAQAGTIIPSRRASLTDPILALRDG